MNTVNRGSLDGPFNILIGFLGHGPSIVLRSVDSI